jgi:hypothetical protein
MLGFLILILIGILSYILFCGDNRDIIDEINKEAKELVRISHDIRENDLNIMAKRASREGKRLGRILAEKLI